MNSGNCNDREPNPRSAIDGRRLTRLEYEKMVESGQIVPCERLELIDGEILNMAPQESAHGTAISLAENWIRAAFGMGFTVRLQLPLALDPYSEPEPDLAVVYAVPDDRTAGHPGTALLVVEVADSTLAYDRTRKGSLYARAGIADYWIVNLADRRLEIYRDPAPAPSAPFGWNYAWSRYYASGQQVMPLASRGAFVSVADLLP